MATKERVRKASRPPGDNANEVASANGTAAKRVFTPARIVALGLIGLAIFGLAYLRLAPDGDEVSVPAGAKAGDIILESCDYATEDGNYAADCGTLVVRENPADPGSRLIALPVTRIRAQSEQPAEPIFYLEGGPGITNMKFKQASRYAVNHDVVLVGYRGVDGSVRLECPEVTSALEDTSDYVSEKAYRAYGDAYRACADRLTAEGVDLTRYGLVQQVDDFEAARKALGYEQVDLLSQSAGTRTAMIYAWRYPGSIHRSAMIGVNPPGNFLWPPTTTDEQIGRYAELCSEDPSCSGRTDDLAATLRETDIPDRWLFLPIKEDNVRIASLFGLMESTAEANPVGGPVVLDAWLSAAEGDARGFWFASLPSRASPASPTWTTRWRPAGAYSRWTVVRGSDLEKGESQGLPVWSRHVGDPVLESNLTRRIDFALFMVEALENDELVHEAPAIVGRLTPSALAHAAPAD
jgi:pimeloyl-ACP methyl ester carboxylesterase